MNRETAKTKDKTPAREKCFALLNRERPVFPAKAAKELEMLAGSVHARMWELCLDGRAHRVDVDGEFGYYLTLPENIEKAAAHYQAIQGAKDIKKWKAVTEKILKHLPSNLQGHLKALKNEINKVA